MPRGANRSGKLWRIAALHRQVPIRNFRDTATDFQLGRLLNEVGAGEDYMMKYFAVAMVTLVTVAGGTAFAQGSDVRGFDRPDGSVVQSPARDAAIHDCSVKSAQYSSRDWQTTQFAVYGECMTDHNQPE